MGVTKERKEQDQDQEEGQDMELYERSRGKEGNKDRQVDEKDHKKMWGGVYV